VQLNTESVVMTLKTYPKLTDATTDRELIRLWISFKAKTERRSLKVRINKNNFAENGSGLSQIKKLQTLIDGDFSD
jgi:hypothetical protein